MKNDLKVKYLRYLSAKKENEGFTLIELLVVIIIIGILSAIALPSFLNQANKARESEAKQYTGSMNRAQQSYYLEEQAFSSAFGTLGLGITTETANYTYYISETIADVGTFTAADSEERDATFSVGDPLNSDTLRSFVGGVDVLKSGGAATTIAVLCQSEDAGDPTNTAVTLDTDTTTSTEPVCGAGFENLAD